MNTLSNKINNKSSNLYLILFSIFLYKFSFSFGGDGLSGNYSFILLPLFIIGISGKIKTSNFFNKYFVIYLAIFMIATLYQYSNLEFFTRRFVSFLIFISIFFYTLFDVDIKMINSFKYALIIVSLYMSLFTLYSYIKLGGSDLGFAAKDAVGGQRFGFVYVMSFWILFFEDYSGILRKFFKFLFLLIIFLGILLTFSRSGIVAIFLSAMIYFTTKLYYFFKNNKTKELINLLFFIILIIILLILFLFIFPEIYSFFNARLFIFFAKGGIEEMDLGNTEGSEGFRIYMLQLILKYVLSNPITGSGFLGVWVLFENHSGSSHNQYTDILFRTGIIGFFTYIYILYKISKYLYKIHIGIFWGLIGVFIYGFFHETFKESQGGFILAFLIGMYTSFHKTSMIIKINK